MLYCMYLYTLHIFAVVVMRKDFSVKLLSNNRESFNNKASLFVVRMVRMRANREIRREVTGLIISVILPLVCCRRISETLCSSTFIRRFIVKKVV